MTKIIGITGGIGSGKSTLSNHLKKLGFLVHESDVVVNKMYNKPTKGFIQFLKKCGFEKALKDKVIDKKLITHVVFNKKTIRKKLEKYIHKQVSLERERFIIKNLKTKKKALFLQPCRRLATAGGPPPPPTPRI